MMPTASSRQRERPVATAGYPILPILREHHTLVPIAQKSRVSFVVTRDFCRLGYRSD